MGPMPESKGRKPPKKRPAKAAPRKRVLPPPSVAEAPPAKEKPNRSPIEEAERLPLPEIPEPATNDQLLVALAGLDPLKQEAMIAQRISAMPSQKDGGMPVNIHRYVRGPWAHQLRKLGIFCIPELATHRLVPNAAAGIMANHSGGELESINTSVEGLWAFAREQNPGLADLVDNADTPEKRAEAMKTLMNGMPMEHKIAMQKLQSHDPEDLTPR